MAFTEVSSESWFGRLGGAFKGILVGGLLFLVAFPLQFWNEGRAVRRIKTLAEGKGAVIADVSTESVNSDNEGKLIHMIGEATATGTLRDKKFDVSIENALKLRRNVEMYQWHEDVETKTKKKVGGGKRTEKTYSYHKEWSSHPIDSSDFQESGRSDYGNGNPPMPFQSDTWKAKKILVGAFRLNDSLSNKISNFQNLDVTDQLENVPAKLQEKLVSNNGGFYLGDDPANPKIGDVRINFSVVKPSQVSFISEQSGETFKPYTAKSVDGTIERLEIGQHSVDEMFKHMESENTMLTWLIRAGGLLLMVVGIGMMMAPLAVVADVIPFVGGIVGAGTWLIALLLGSFFSLVTISLAWIFYRPIFGIGLLAIAIAIGIFAFMRTSRASKVNLKTDDGIPVIG